MKFICYPHNKTLQKEKSEIGATANVIHIQRPTSKSLKAQEYKAENVRGQKRRLCSETFPN